MQMSNTTTKTFQDLDLSQKILATLAVKGDQNIRQIEAVCEMSLGDETLELTLHDLINKGLVKTFNINRRRHYAIA